MNSTIQWLLEEKEPSIRYRTLVELLDKPFNDTEVVSTKEGVLRSKNVTRLFSRLDENGLFPHKADYYGNFTTFNYLYALSELGLNSYDEHIKHIVDWILTPGSDKHEHFMQKEFQNENAYLLDPSNIGSCRQVHFLYTLVKLGFLEDDRVQALINAFVNKSRFDGGYLCKWKKSNYPMQTPKSCYKATVPALLVYSALPQGYRENKEYKNLIEYFKGRNLIYSKIEPDRVIADTSLSLYSGGLSHILILAYAMSKLGFGNIPEMSPVWDILENKKDDTGRYILERAETKKAINMDGVGKPNKWITLYVLLALKYKNNH